MNLLDVGGREEFFIWKMDKLSPEERIKLMSKIKGKNTKPEMIVRSFLWKKGFRYRLHRRDLPGCPDLVFFKMRKAIFVNGCFWHGYHCKEKYLPKTRVDFWMNKIEKIKSSDKSNYSILKNLGWLFLQFGSVI